MDKTPLVGDFMARFLKGGPTPGQMTLSRFFVIHVMILPAALMGLAGLHLFLFRAAGPAGPFAGRRKKSARRPITFSHGRSGKTSSEWRCLRQHLCLGLLGTGRAAGRSDTRPGDYHPEPEWYFLFLFQLLRLKVFAGEFGQFLGAIALPGAFMALLAALPFIDRDPERNIFKRPIALISWIAVMTAILLFTVSAIINREFLD